MAKSELEKLISERNKLIETRDKLKYEKSKKNRDVKIAELTERIDKLTPKKIDASLASDSDIETINFRYKDFLTYVEFSVPKSIFTHIGNFFKSMPTIEEFISESDSKHNCYCCVDYKSYPKQQGVYTTNVIYDYLYNLGIIDNTITVENIDYILQSLSDFHNTNNNLICLPMVNIRVPKRFTFLQNKRFFRMWVTKEKYLELGITNKDYINDYFYSTNLVINSELKRLKISDCSNAEKHNILRNAPYTKVDLKQRYKDIIDKEKNDD